ncbi:MAG: hypothetical protein WED11_06025 [Natronospirillum sp.]
MKRRHKEWLVVVGASAAVMLASVVITFVATQPLQEGDQRTFLQRVMNADVQEVVPSELSLQIAYEACRSRIVSDVGSELQSLSFDNRASRYNREERMYQVFVNVYFRGTTDSVYSRCNISSVTGEVLEYRLRSDGGIMFRLF